MAWLVREAVWHSRSDMERVARTVIPSRQWVMPTPTIALRDAPLDAERLGGLLDRAASFRVPVVWMQDGESVCSNSWREGFEFFSRDQPPAALRLEWGYEKPAEWRPILEWHRRLRRFLDESLSALESKPARSPY